MAHANNNHESKNKITQTQTIGPAKKYTNTMNKNATTKEISATYPITSLTVLRSVTIVYAPPVGKAFLITEASSKFAGTHKCP